MPADIEIQLRELGEWFRAELAHVDPDEILGTATEGRVVGDSPLLELDDEGSGRIRRGHWLYAVAAAAVLVIAGVIAAVGRDADIEPAAGTEAESLPAGAMVLPQSSGMNVTQIRTGAIAGDVAIRWYATEGARPESRTFLLMMTVPQQWSGEGPSACEMALSETREEMLDSGTSACLEVRDTSDPFGTISVRRPSAEVIITGRATDEELLAAAAAVIEATVGPGYEIAAPGLPPDVALTGIGWNVSDFATVSVDDTAGPLLQVGWEAADGTSMFYVASRGDFMANNRIGFNSITATITDITVRGQPGFMRTLADQPNYVGVVWRENDMTYQVGSQGLGTERLLALIEQLRPATRDEWETIEVAGPRLDLPSTTLEGDVIGAPSTERVIAADLPRIAPDDNPGGYSGRLAVERAEEVERLLPLPPGGRLDDWSTFNASLDSGTETFVDPASMVYDRIDCIWLEWLDSAGHSSEATSHFIDFASARTDWPDITFQPEPYGALREEQLRAARAGDVAMLRSMLEQCRTGSSPPGSPVDQFLDQYR